MSKATKVDIVNEDTKMSLVKAGRAYGIIFHFGKRTSRGIGATNPDVAMALSGYFKQMAKALAARASDQGEK